MATAFPALVMTGIPAPLTFRLTEVFVYMCRKDATTDLAVRPAAKMLPIVPRIVPRACARTAVMTATPARMIFAQAKAQGSVSMRR